MNSRPLLTRLSYKIYHSLMSLFLVIVENILTPTCIASGAIMCLLSFLLFVFEATFCCAKVSAAQPLITRMEKLRFWHRAALYCGLVLFATKSTKLGIRVEYFAIVDNSSLYISLGLSMLNPVRNIQ